MRNRWCWYTGAHPVLADRWPLLPSALLEVCSRRVHRCRVVLQNLGHAGDLFFCLGVALLFNCFANAGDGLCVVAGVITWSIDQVLVPRAARQPFGIGEPALGLE